MSENMKRGMTRICLVLATLWALGMGWYQYQEWQKIDDNSLTIALDKDTELRIDSSGIRQNDKQEMQLQRLLLIVLPALALLLVVPVSSWVSGGFKKEGQ
jgi:hypothetical protein